MWKKWRNRSPNSSRSRATLRRPLEVRLAGDDRDHQPVARIVGLGQRADRLVQLLERLGVGRDEGDVEQPARVGDGAPAGAGGGRGPAAPARAARARADRRPRPAARPRRSSSAIRVADERDEPLDLGQPGRRVGQGERPGPPVGGHRPTHPAERDADAAGQRRSPCRASRSRRSGRTRRRSRGTGTTAASGLRMSSQLTSAGHDLEQRAG